MDLIKSATPYSKGDEVKGGKYGREPHSLPGNLQGAHHLQEETVQTDRVNKAHCIQTRQGFLWKVADQSELEEALG